MKHFEAGETVWVGGFPATVVGHRKDSDEYVEVIATWSGRLFMDPRMLFKSRADAFNFAGLTASQPTAGCKMSKQL